MDNKPRPEAKQESEISKLDESLQIFLSAVNQFPRSQRSKEICGSWGLREILAHLSAWNRLTIRDLGRLRSGESISWMPDSKIDRFNALSVAVAKSCTWGQIYSEFISSSQALLLAYGGLTVEEWSKRFGPDVDNTPYRSLLVDIAHYNDHLGEIQEVLETIVLKWPKSIEA